MHDDVVDGDPFGVLVRTERTAPPLVHITSGDAAPVRTTPLTLVGPTPPTHLPTPEGVYAGSHIPVDPEDGPTTAIPAIDVIPVAPMTNVPM